MVVWSRRASSGGSVDIVVEMASYWFSMEY
jgi:hypothetical protein